jgi:hypothetical protein
MSPRKRYAVRLVLGGLVWGSLLGTVLGAVLGVLYGLLADDVGLGLDGAVLGCFSVAFLGALYGAALEWRRPRRDPSAATADSWVSVNQVGRRA